MQRVRMKFKASHWMEVVPYATHNMPVDLIAKEC